MKPSPIIGQSWETRERKTPGFPLELAYRLTILSFILTFLLASTVWGCSSQSSTSIPPICVAGSTSVQPFAEKLAEVFMADHPHIRIDIQGGGSSAGIFAVSQGACHLGASSRELVAKEKGMVEIPMAWDGIAVIVNPKNPLKNLSLEQLRLIFQGKIRNWADVGLPPHAIHLISREEGSGTRNAFEEMVMQKHEVSPAALVQDSNGSVREIVANDPHAMGYISVGLVDDRVKALQIDGIPPTRNHIRNHTYKLVRRFLLVSRLPPQGPVREFINFVLSAQGQSLLEAEGLVGIEE